jgi:hypothetical protein
MEVLIDKDDYEYLNSFKWGIINNGSHKYAARGTRKKGQPYRKILMHREILNCPKNKMIDHINGNTLDNRKENLRIVTRAKNLQNSKKRSDSNFNYKGIGKRNGKYFARIQIAVDKRLFLGYYNTDIEAARAYDIAAKLHFGENARLNFKE